jgi:hypothetical protein
MLDMQHNFAAVARSLEAIRRRQLPFAISQALNDTGKDVVDVIPRHMERVFDRPTPFAKNAFMLVRSTKGRLVAVVDLKPSADRKHFLRVQQYGGIRPQTGTERTLASRLAYSGQIVNLTPARGARMDRYGNWSAGERNQALSAIKAQRDPTSNTTAASRARNPRRAQYFVPRPGSKLSPGIWKRQGQRIVKVAHFTSAQSSYRPRLNLRRMAEVRASLVFDGHLARRLAAAIATAR